jgi:hypothetical protein
MGETMPPNEITVELSAVTGVTKDNFEEVVKKVEELFGKELEESGLGLLGIWPPDMSPEEQAKQFKEKDEIQLYFFKVRN